MPSCLLKYIVYKCNYLWSSLVGPPKIFFQARPLLRPLVVLMAVDATAGSLDKVSFGGHSGVRIWSWMSALVECVLRPSSCHRGVTELNLHASALMAVTPARAAFLTSLRCSFPCQGFRCKLTSFWTQQCDALHPGPGGGRWGMAWCV
jgi:hypothetical protein